MREWSLHKLLADPQVLESIEKLTISNFDLQLLQSILLLVVEVEPHVIEPSKVMDRLNLFVNELTGYFSLVHEICD